MRYDFTRHFAECAEIFYCPTYEYVPPVGVYYHWVKVMTVFRQIGENPDQFINRARTVWSRVNGPTDPIKYRIRFQPFPTDDVLLTTEEFR